MSPEPPQRHEVGQLFHIAPAAGDAAATVSREFGSDFDIQHIFSLRNEFTEAQFAARKNATGRLRGTDKAEEKIAYHVTKGGLFQICQTGLDARLSQKGFFGKAIYMAFEAVKANDYSVDKGNPAAIRVMLRCKVLQGVCKEFELGRFDRDLIMEPEGYDSVSGFIRRGTELALYTSDRVCVTHIILYKYLNTQLETGPVLNVPPNVSGHIVYITAALSEFFSKLQLRAGAPATQEHVAMKRLTGRLLKKELAVAEFLVAAGEILHTDPPLELADKISSELKKCRLDPQPGTAPPPPPPPPSPEVPEPPRAENVPPQLALPTFAPAASPDTPFVFRAQFPTVPVSWPPPVSPSSYPRPPPPDLTRNISVSEEVSSESDSPKRRRDGSRE